MEPRRTRVGAVQLRILRVLWEHKRASARQITEALSAEGPIAHSTVQTLLRKLEKKGAVAHDAEERVFIFRALVSEEEVVRDATQDLLSRVFDGSAYGLVAHLLKSESISSEELAAILKLIDEAGEEQ